MTLLDFIRDPLFWSKIAVGYQDDCWPWLGRCLPKGYGRLTRHKRTYLAHRWAWILTYGAVEDGRFVLHRCDNPPCCNPRHLFLGTHLDNMADMARKGRANGGGPIGERNGRAKLTLSDVQAICESSATGVELAKRYGVGTTQISRIKRRERWPV